MPAVSYAPGDVVDVVRLHDVRDLRVHREPVPAPAPGEVLVRVTAVGICGSDIHWYQEARIGDSLLTRPVVPGHEFAGTIVDGPRAGDRVVGEPADPCGDCPECHAGRTNLCQDVRFSGHASLDGPMRTVMPWPEELLLPIPDSIGDDEAALLEPSAIGLYALSLGAPRLGGSAGVLGCGPIGLLLVQLLRLAGVETIVATDRLGARVEAARALGATHAVEVGHEGVRDLDLPPVEVSFEAAGTDEAVADALELVRPGGRVVLVGIPAGDRTTFSASVARRKGLTLLLSRRSRPIDLEGAVRLAAAGRLELRSLVTDRFALSDVATAFERASTREGLKVLVKP